MHATHMPLLALRGGVSGAAAAQEVDVQALVVQATLYVGSAMSALSGTISAGTKQMDVLGCVVVGALSALLFSSLLSQPLLSLFRRFSPRHTRLSQP